MEFVSMVTIICLVFYHLGLMKTCDYKIACDKNCIHLKIFKNFYVNEHCMCKFSIINIFCLSTILFCFDVSELEDRWIILDHDIKSAN